MSVPTVATGFPSPNTAGSFTPARILSVVAVLVLIFIIFAPQEREDAGAAYNSYSANTSGTRALYETLTRLGFVVTRNERSLTQPPDSSSVFILLRPAQALTAIERNNLLASVRNGMTLLFTPDDEELADSLGFDVQSERGGFYTLAGTSVAGGNPPSREAQDPRVIYQAAFPISTIVVSTSHTPSQTFLWIQPLGDARQETVDSTRQPALVLGHHFGRGYAVAITPAEIVTNQVMHEPRAAMAIVRAIQFANETRPSASQPGRVVFDEYHHGFGTHADMPAAIAHALADTPPGRMTLEVVAAALVLLIAFAVRPLAPVSIPPVSRRSPLEHVGALAHAYSQVNARKLGANWLVRGLRRRHSLGLSRSVPDRTYLSALRDRLPSASSDVDRLLTALAPDSPDSSDRFATTGAAVANIERHFESD